MVDRIFKSWKTTALGAVIIIGALVFVYLDKASLTEAGAFMGVGLSLFFLKDGKSNNN